MKYFLKSAIFTAAITVLLPFCALAATNLGSRVLTGPSTYVCTTTGFFPHPNERDKFYHCQRNPVNPSTLVAYGYQCNTGECFNAASGTVQCTASACPKNGTEEFSCLRNALQRDAERTCFDETMDNLKKLRPKMLDFTAYRGDAQEDLLATLRDLNWDMRDNYAKMIENTGKNTLPLMVVTETEPDFHGLGGVFKIYFKDGSMRRIIPVSREFEMYKALSHIPLGIFSIISPYFRNPVSIAWQHPLRQFLRHCKNVHFLVNKLPQGTQRTLALSMTTAAVNYMERTIANEAVSVLGYRQFAQVFAPLIEDAMEIAVKAHARDTIPALQQLKAEMGEEEWRKLHVIITTVWPLSLYNIRLQSLEKVMSFEQIKDQVLIVEGSQSEDGAKTTLGRVVADRVVAQLLWGDVDNEEYKDHLFGLSTRRDVLSTRAARELNKVCDQLEQQNVKPKCPFSGRTGNARSLGGNEVHATMFRH